MADRELTAELLEKLKRRSADPERRTDAPPSMRGQDVAGIGGFRIMGLDLGKLLRGEPPAVEPTETPSAAPVSVEAIASREAELGFALPIELRQLYAEVADGGFGPGPGLLPLAGLVARYRDLTARPQGRRRQQWPTELLPLIGWDVGLECLDRSDGRVIFWDEEELADGPSDKVWMRSFKPSAASLADWLEAWAGRPSPAEEAEASLRAAQIAGLKQSLAHFRSMTPQQRADSGLPETGWEQELFGHLGIDLSKLDD